MLSIALLFLMSWALVAPGISLAHPTTEARDAAAKAQVRQILQLSKPSWLENIAVRPNGELLVTRLDVPELYLVNPFTNNYSVIATFSGVNAAFGITEYKPDVYAVAVGNSTGLTSTLGTYSIQTVDLSKGLSKDGKAPYRLLTRIPQAQNINGLTFRAPRTLYGADSYAFKLYAVDVETGAAQVAVDADPLFDGTSFPLGINGVRWPSSSSPPQPHSKPQPQELVFTNTAQNIIGSLALRPDGSFAPARLVARNPIANMSESSYDDLTLDAAGDVYATTNRGNTVDFIPRDGKSPQRVVAGNKTSTQIAGPCAAAFGRTPADRDTLYVVTAGGEAAPINGTIVVGAQVVAIKLGGRHAGGK